MMRLLCPLPSLDQIGIDIEQVEKAPYRMIDDVIYGLRLVVESWQRWRHDGTHLRGLVEKPAVTGMQWRFTWHKDKFSALLECYVGSSHHQIVRVGVHDAGEGFH